jgi:hypothetical protein
MIEYAVHVTDLSYSDGLLKSLTIIQYISWAQCMCRAAEMLKSADPLLANPALFSDLPPGQQPWGDTPATRGCQLLQRYLNLVDMYPTHPRMIRAHTHRLLGDWLQVGLVGCSKVILVQGGNSITRRNPLQMLSRCAGSESCTRCSGMRAIFNKAVTTAGACRHQGSDHIGALPVNR